MIFIVTIGFFLVVNRVMGRTVPSFRAVLAMEQAEWKPFRNGLDKSERKIFDEMFDIPRLYITACSNSVQLVPLQPIIMSILFHHYKELKECMSEVEEIEAKANNSSNNKSRAFSQEEIEAELQRTELQGEEEEK